MVADGAAPPLSAPLTPEEQSRRARFDLGPHKRVLQEALGTLPPGYGLTVIRAWIRDPVHLAAAWDVNDEHDIAACEKEGWHRLILRVFDDADRLVREVYVGKRSGVWHFTLPQSGLTLRVALTLVHADGFARALARSGAVRLPSGFTGESAPEERLRLPARLDRRALLRTEAPPRPGHGFAGLFSPAHRLQQRLALGLRLMQRVAGTLHRDAEEVAGTEAWGDAQVGGAEARAAAAAGAHAHALAAAAAQRAKRTRTTSGVTETGTPTSPAGAPWSLLEEIETESPANFEDNVSSPGGGFSRPPST